MHISSKHYRNKWQACNIVTANWNRQKVIVELSRILLAPKRIGISYIAANTRDGPDLSDMPHILLVQLVVYVYEEFFCVTV